MYKMNIFEINMLLPSNLIQMYITYISELKGHGSWKCLFEKVQLLLYTGTGKSVSNLFNVHLEIQKTHVHGSWKCLFEKVRVLLYTGTGKSVSNVCNEHFEIEIEKRIFYFQMYIWKGAVASVHWQFWFKCTYCTF